MKQNSSVKYNGYTITAQPNAYLKRYAIISDATGWVVEYETTVERSKHFVDKLNAQPKDEYLERLRLNIERWFSFQGRPQVRGFFTHEKREGKDMWNCVFLRSATDIEVEFTPLSLPIFDTNTMGQVLNAFIKGTKACR